MYFDTDTLDDRSNYKLITATVVPRPIAWVVTLDAEGRTNAAPFSFFNAFSGAPPVVCVGVGERNGKRKDTLANIEREREFVVNLVAAENVEGMNVTAIDFPTGVDEIEKAGLTRAASVKVRPPRIAESPVALECRLTQVLDVGRANHIAVADVLAIHVRDDAVIDAAKCYIDSSRLGLVGRMQSPGSYVRTTDVFKLSRIALEDWENGNRGV